DDRLVRGLLPYDVRLHGQAALAQWYRPTFEVASALRHERSARTCQTGGIEQGARAQGRLEDSVEQDELGTGRLCELGRAVDHRLNCFFWICHSDDHTFHLHATAPTTNDYAS